MKLVKENFSAPEDHSWLGSSHGTDSTDSITLDKDTCVAVFTSGVMPSGVAVGKILSGGDAGKYGPYSAAATDGRQIAAGALYTTVDFGTTNVVDKGGALLKHGQIISAKLPTDHGWTDNARAHCPGLIFEAPILPLIVKIAGAPTNDVTLVDIAGIGQLLMNTSNGKLYSATATGSGTITWTVVGTQS